MDSNHTDEIDHAGVIDAVRPGPTNIEKDERLGLTADGSPLAVNLQTHHHDK